MSPDQSSLEFFSRRFLLALLSVSIFLFAALYLLLSSGSLDAIDQKTLTLFRAHASFDDPLGPPWMEESLRDVTALGSRAVLGLLLFSLSALLVLKGRRDLAGALVLAAVVIVALNTALKLGIDRPRPQIVKHEARVFTPSFPSAHAMESSSIYLISAYLLCLAGRSRRLMRTFTFSLAIFTIFAVGISRMYLGVHYPSDIVSGWLMGTACAAAFILLAQRLQPRKIDLHTQSHEVPSPHHN